MPKTTPGAARASVILDEQDVAKYLREHGLTFGYHELEAALIQYGDNGDPRPAPCALLVVDVDGKKCLVKTSLRLFITIAETLDAAAKREHGEHWRGL